MIFSLFLAPKNVSATSLTSSGLIYSSVNNEIVAGSGFFSGATISSAIIIHTIALSAIPALSIANIILGPLISGTIQTTLFLIELSVFIPLTIAFPIIFGYVLGGLILEFFLGLPFSSSTGISVIPISSSISYSFYIPFSIISTLSTIFLFAPIVLVYSGATTFINLLSITSSLPLDSLLTIGSSFLTSTSSFPPLFYSIFSNILSFSLNSFELVSISNFVSSYFNYFSLSTLSFFLSYVVSFGLLINETGVAILYLPLISLFLSGVFYEIPFFSNFISLSNENFSISSSKSYLSSNSIFSIFPLSNLLSIIPAYIAPFSASSGVFINSSAYISSLSAISSPSLSYSLSESIGYTLNSLISSSSSILSSISSASGAFISSPISSIISSIPGINLGFSGAVLSVPSITSSAISVGGSSIGISSVPVVFGSAGLILNFWGTDQKTYRTEKRAEIREGVAERAGINNTYTNDSYINNNNISNDYNDLLNEANELIN